MKQIKTLTDKEILGTDGLPTAKPRLTARAIIRNLQNQYAVLYAEEFDLYSLPGGGVENDEEIEVTLRREVAEETGVHILKIEELGYVGESRAYCDFTQISYYFVVTTDSVEFKPHFTEDEKRHGTSVAWYSFDEAYSCIANVTHSTVQRKYLQARDVAALDAYRKNL